MLKKIILSISLMLCLNIAQDFEMPGLGLYAGGIMGTASGDAVDNLEDLGYSLSGPMLGFSYATMVGDFPLFMGAGLGARSFAYKGGHDGHDHGDDHNHDEEDISVCFQYFDMWATIPYPINDSMNLYGGMLFGIPLSGKETHGDEDPEDLDDEQLPNGMDMGLVFGLGYALPVMDGALALNLGYALGLAELESDAGGSNNTWSHSGFFMSLNYDIPGM
mgnify:FL=1